MPITTITTVKYLAAGAAGYAVATCVSKLVCGKHLHELIAGGTAVVNTFVDSILADCAGAIASETGHPKQEVLDALWNRYRHEGSPEILSTLVRIDYEVEKKTPAVCLLTAHILFSGGESARKVSIQREEGWEYLPAEIRGKFIRTNCQKQTFILIDVEHDRNAE